MSLEAEFFNRSIEFVLNWEGGYWNGGEDPMAEVNFGITKRWFPHLDIKALTRDQAIQIYYSHYWRPSKAFEFGWPRCLIILDTSVNMGISTYRQLYDRSNGNMLTFLGLRLRMYTADRRWADWGAGWTNRVADLMIEVAPTYGAGPIELN